MLVDCVAGGASVGFLYRFTHQRAVAFWRRIVQAVAAAERALLVAEDEHGICGTVHVILAQPENQPHRADVTKMLVHRRARLYARLGWQRVGDVPGDALMPDGAPVATTVYYRPL